MNGEVMAREMAEQPGVFERILRDGQHPIRDVARMIRKRAPGLVLFLARGSSENAAVYARYLVETRLQLPTGFLAPSITTLYGARPDHSNALVLAISQSGGSPDLVDSLEQSRNTGAITVAMTNNAASPLAGSADYHLDLQAGPERAVTATKTYTAELFTLYCLVQAIAEGTVDEAADLPERAENILALDADVAVLAHHYRNAHHFVTAARGYNYATAREAALKLMETSYVVAQGLSSAELMHGPIAMIDRGFPVIALVPVGEGGAVMMPVLERLQQSGADLLVAGDPGAMRYATHALPLPKLPREELTPMLLALPMQQFAWHLAHIRGTDPDEPRGLKKHTSTW